ncbi:MAG: type II secretion system protein GspM [Gammaproteobacteria bacterium]
MKLPEPLTHWYGGLALRERRLVAIVGVIVAVLILYLAIVQPIASAHSRLAQEVQANRALLVWLDNAEARIRATGPGEGGGSGHLAPGSSVFSAVSNAAQNGPVSASVQRIEQSGDGGVRLTLNAVPFDSLVNWLGTLNSSNGIVVANASVQQADSPGTVNATITLNAGP